MAQTSRISRNNTKVNVDAGGVTTVRLYQTDVIKFPADRSWVEFNTGGYRTVTTRTRINQACNQFGLNAAVHQVRGEWFAWVNGVSYPLIDGVHYCVEE